MAAGLSALLAGGAGVTETEMFTRSALAFVLFALLTKGVAVAATYLVPELAGGTAGPAEVKGGTDKGAVSRGAVRNAPAAPDDRGGRLNVVLPGTSAEEMLNAGTGKEVAG